MVRLLSTEVASVLEEIGFDFDEILLESFSAKFSLVANRIEIFVVSLTKEMGTFLLVVDFLTTCQ